jgi:hypothetical protein
MLPRGTRHALDAIEGTRPSGDRSTLCLILYLATLSNPPFTERSAEYILRRRVFGTDPDACNVRAPVRGRLVDGAALFVRVVDLSQE